MPKKHASATITDQRSRTALIDLAPLTLRAEVRAESIDQEARTAEVIFSTGAPVERFDWMAGKRYIETLSLEPGAVRLRRLNGGAPFLNAHNAFELAAVIGVVEPKSARIEDGKAYATVRFSKREDVEPIWRDILDRIIRNVSVGYRVHKYEEREENGKAFRHAVDWEPYEISAVPMGADIGAKVRDDAKGQANPCVIIRRGPQGDTTMVKMHCTDCQAEVELRDGEACPTCQGRNLERIVPSPVAPPVVTRDPNDPGRPLETAEEAGTRQVVQTERQQGADAETGRVQGIIRAVRNGGLAPEFADRLIAEHISLVQAQSMVLDEVARRGGEGRGPGRTPTGIQVVSDPGDHVRAGITNALLHRADPTYAPWKLTDLGRSYAHRSLMEYAELCIQARGHRTTGMSKMEIAGLALALNSAGMIFRAGMHTVSDFPFILADVANKTLRRAYEEAPQTFTAIARRVPLPDFKTVNRVQLGEAPSLDPVGDHGEFQSGTIGEGREQYALGTYGKVFGLTRKALINDDTDAFSRLTMMFGRSARHLESDLVWKQVTDNANMGDGVALFHATHGNLTAAGTAISVDSLGVGRALMRNQKGLNAVQFLNLVPRYIAVPPGKETIADQFVTVITPAEGGKVNPFAGRLAVLSEPRLEAASVTAWYLFADPMQVDIVEWGVLAGEEGPVIETQVGFKVDGIEIKCRHDVAAKIIDWRGAYKNGGA